MPGRWPCTHLHERSPHRRCMECWSLPSACIEPLPVPPPLNDSSAVYETVSRMARTRHHDGAVDPTTWNVYRLHGGSGRTVRVHVDGLSSSALRVVQKSMRSIRDPLCSTRVRHVERVVTKLHSRDARKRATWSSYPSKNLTMVWPIWEMGFGDGIAHLLLPLGQLLRLNAMPADLALSGLRHDALLPPLAAATSSLCSFERPNPPLLPRCRPACYGFIHVCAPRYTDTRDAFEASSALEARLSPPTTGSDGAEGRGNADGSSDGDGVLRVLFAERAGRRRIVNLERLAAACNGSTLRPNSSSASTWHVHVRCEIMASSASPAMKRRQLHGATVFVAMWGGDTLHALSLPRGSAVVELRHATFVKGAPWSWVSMARRWVMRYSGPLKRRPLSFYAMHLSENETTVPSQETQACVLNASLQTRAHPIVDERWRCFWNVDVAVDFDRHLRPVLERIVDNRRRGVIGLGTDDICTKRVWGGRTRLVNGTRRSAGCPS